MVTNRSKPPVRTLAGVELVEDHVEWLPGAVKRADQGEGLRGARRQ
jgi:hypothetical protein